MKRYIDQFWSVLVRFVTQPRSFVDDIRRDKAFGFEPSAPDEVPRLASYLPYMLLATALGSGAYGIVVGLKVDLGQVVLLLVKFPLLLLITTVIAGGPFIVLFSHSITQRGSAPEIAVVILAGQLLATSLTLISLCPIVLFAALTIRNSAVFFFICAATAGFAILLGLVWQGQTLRELGMGGWKCCLWLLWAVCWLLIGSKMAMIFAPYFSRTGLFLLNLRSPNFFYALLIKLEELGGVVQTWVPRYDCP